MALKVIIAGSRYFSDLNLIRKTMNELYGDNPIEVVCGGASGADYLGSIWAMEKGYFITYFPADWTTHGKMAGFLRNKQMGMYTDEAVIFWDGESKGSKMMIDIMKKLKKPVSVIKYEEVI